MNISTERKLILLGMILYVLFPDPMPGPLDDIIILILGTLFRKKLEMRDN